MKPFGFDNDEWMTSSKPRLAELTVELVPSTSWGHNLRSALSTKQWDQVRKHTYADWGHRCGVCGGVGPRHPVECHEIWEYNDESHIQTLAGLIALCPVCHEVKHLGRAMSVGNGQRARQHLMMVNDWSAEQVYDYVDEVFSTWKNRSAHNWRLDLSWLERTFGIHVDPT